MWAKAMIDILTRMFVSILVLVLAALLTAIVVGCASPMPERDDRPEARAYCSTLPFRSGTWKQGSAALRWRFGAGRIEGPALLLVVGGRMPLVSATPDEVDLCVRKRRRA